MKSDMDVNRARSLLCTLLSDPDLKTHQRAALSGMSIALQWVMDVEHKAGGRNVLARLMDGETVDRQPLLDPADRN